MLALRTKPEEENVIRAYAELHGMTVSEFLRKSALEKIEDEFDLKLSHEAMEEFKENPFEFGV